MDSERQIAELTAQLDDLHRQVAALQSQVGGAGREREIRIVSPYTEDPDDYPEQPDAPGILAEDHSYPIRFWSHGHAGNPGYPHIVPRSEKEQVATAHVFPVFAYGQSEGDRRRPPWLARNFPCLGLRDNGQWYILPFLHPTIFAFARSMNGDWFKACDADGDNIRGDAFEVTFPHNSHDWHDAEHTSPQNSEIFCQAGDVIVYAYTGQNAENRRIYVAGGRRRAAFKVRAQEDWNGSGVTVKLVSTGGPGEYGDDLFCHLPCPPTCDPYVFEGDYFYAQWFKPHEVDEHQPDCIAFGYYDIEIGRVAIYDAGSNHGAADHVANNPYLDKGFDLFAVGKVLCGPAGAHGAELESGTDVPLEFVTFIKRVR